MKHIILIPDSFKGTMSSLQICDIMEREIKKYFDPVRISKLPVADGGEGSVDAFLSAVPGERVNVSVSGPVFRKIHSFYGIIDEGKTAIIETAACAGLPLMGNALDARGATTYGVGELIKHAVENNCKKIIVGLGGSATTDGGCGLAAALGVRFLTHDNKEFVPTGGTLQDIAAIDVSNLDPAIKNKKAEIIGMCDIDNPLYGENGSAYIFSPQKGADAKTVELLDRGLRHLAETVAKDLNIDAANRAGAGAAGGMGFGLTAFLGGSLRMGIDLVLDAVRFDELLADADMVFTGEGKIDSQSLRGKVVVGVARRAKKREVPVIAVVGDIGDDCEAVYDEGVSVVVSINRVAKDFMSVKHRAPHDMALTMDSILRQGFSMKEIFWQRTVMIVKMFDIQAKYAEFCTVKFSTIPYIWVSA